MSTTLVARTALFVSFLVTTVACPLRACVVGDPTAAPQVVIVESPPDCCYGEWAGSLHGSVRNVDTRDAVVVIYARTDLFYVQPTVGATVEIGCGGHFSAATHGGATYTAILAQRGWQPPAQMAALPPVGGPILGVVSVPEAQRTIQFAARTWVVKSSGTTPYGPGANLWSEGQDAVWVDALGRLHLRITQRDGVWYSAEVYSLDYVGYGRYRFEVEGALHALDPNAVFSGFVYSDQGDEADIEFSRWGDVNRLDNAQFVVQPDAIHPWSVSVANRHTLELDWSEQRIDFRAWPEAAGNVQQPAAMWSYSGAVPTPDVERMRFNLWLYGGAPANGNEVEVVVTSFVTDVPTDLWARSASRLELHAAQVARSRVRYVVDLPRAGPTRLRVFDPRGRLVARWENAHRQAGRSVGIWQPRVAPSGVYFLQVESGEQRASARIVFLR